MSARHMCGSCQPPSPGSYLGWAGMPSIFLQKVPGSSRCRVVGPHLILGNLKVLLRGVVCVASGLSVDGNLWVRGCFLGGCIDGNKWRRGSLALFGISSQLYHSCTCCVLQGASQQGGRSPKSFLNDFLMSLWVVACPERGVGTAAAARYVMAVSAGLLLTLACFTPLQSHLWRRSAPLLRSWWWWRERQATARCTAKGRFESGNLGTALKASSPARWRPREGTSSALNTHPNNTLPDQLLCQPAVTFNVLPR